MQWLPEVARIRLAGPIAAFLGMFLPLLALVGDVNFSVIPTEVHVDNLPPGEAAGFELT